MTATKAIAQTKEEMQKQLRASLEQVVSQIEKIQGGVAQVTRAGTGHFKLNEGDGSNISIHSCNDLGYLIKALAVMLRTKKEYDQIAEQLQLKSYPPCPWLGQNIDNWIHDLKLRISVVTNAEILNKLIASRAKLTSLLSEESRLTEALEDAGKLLQEVPADLTKKRLTHKPA